MEKKGRIGSSVNGWIAEKMENPQFRIEFYKARGRRIKRAIAENVQRARESRKLTQTQLAKLVKTTQSVISRIETPDLDYLPSIEVMARIADALGAHLEIAFVTEKRKAA